MGKKKQQFMSKKTAYNDSIKELQNILSDLQSEEIDLDSLEHKITRAYKLIEECRSKLRSTEEKLNSLKEE